MIRVLIRSNTWILLQGISFFTDKFFGLNNCKTKLSKIERSQNFIRKATSFRIICSIVLSAFQMHSRILMKNNDKYCTNLPFIKADKSKRLLTVWPAHIYIAAWLPEHPAINGSDSVQTTGVYNQIRCVYGKIMSPYI